MGAEIVKLCSWITELGFFFILYSAVLGHDSSPNWYEPAYATESTQPSGIVIPKSGKDGETSETTAAHLIADQLERGRKIHDGQFGCRKWRSCVDAVAVLTKQSRESRGPPNGRSTEKPPIAERIYRGMDRSAPHNFGVRRGSAGFPGNNGCGQECHR